MCRAGHTHIAVSIFTLNKLPSGQANNVLFCSFVKVREDLCFTICTVHIKSHIKYVQRIQMRTKFSATSFAPSPVKTGQTNMHANFLSRDLFMYDRFRLSIFLNHVVHVKETFFETPFNFGQFKCTYLGLNAFRYHKRFKNDNKLACCTPTTAIFELSYSVSHNCTNTATGFGLLYSKKNIHCYE